MASRVRFVWMLVLLGAIVEVVQVIAFHGFDFQQQPPLYNIFTDQKSKRWASGAAGAVFGAGGGGNQADLYPKPTKNGPALLRNDPACRVWHKFSPDLSFQKTGGRVCVGLEVSTPLAYASPEHATLTQLLVAYTLAVLPVNPDELGEVDLQLELKATVQGIAVTLESSTKKSIEILATLGHQLAVLSEMITKPTFEALRSKLLEEVRQLGSMEDQLNHLTERTLSTPIYHPLEMEAFLQSDRCEPGRLVAFTRAFIENVFLEALVVGGLSDMRARKLIQAFWAALRAKPLSDVARHSVFRQRVLDLPVGCTQSYLLPSSAGNSALTGTGIEIYLQVGPQEGTPLQDALLDLLAEIMKDYPAPAQGQNFRAFTRRLHGVQGFSFCIEDPQLPADELEKIIGKWTLDFRQTALEGLSDDDFLRYKETLLSKKTPKLVFRSRFQRYWKEICLKTYYFDRPFKEAIGLKLVDKNVLLRFWDEYICESAASQQKFLGVVQNQKSHQPLVAVDEVVVKNINNNPCCMIIVDSSGRLLDTKERLSEFWSKIRKITPPSPQNELADELVITDPLNFRIDELV